MIRQTGLCLYPYVESQYKTRNVVILTQLIAEKLQIENYVQL